MEMIKKYFKKFFGKNKKTAGHFTGFEVKVWQEGKLMTRSVSYLEEVSVNHFPCGSFIETPNGLILSGYRIVPNLKERV